MFHLRFKYKCISLLLATALCVSAALPVFAAPLTAEEEARLEAHRQLPAQTNEISGWPAGPIIGAESAILMEAETGAILYAKNIHQKQYPASTTKILTTLLVSELCENDEVVTFSRDAVFDTPRDSNHIAMDVGQTLTIEQCLNAILIRSANEVSFAVAEHITDTTDWSVFAQLMNKRATELGCLNSNFVNPNGLPDENHYTTAYDLAMIGKAFFANEMLCQITLSRRLEIPKSDTIKEAKLEMNAMQIIPGKKYAYEYLVGCKTGFTEDARYSLVSCAEKNGVKLICAVMNDENPYQYEDTISLFNYGFSNFEKLNMSEQETKFDLSGGEMFHYGIDIFANSKPLLSLDEEDSIMLPLTLQLEDLNTTVSYTDESDTAAVISYHYGDMTLGDIRVHFTPIKSDLTDMEDNDTSTGERTSFIPVNIITLVLILLGLGVMGFVVVFFRAALKNYMESRIATSNRRRWKRLNRKRRRSRRRRY